MDSDNTTRKERVAYKKGWTKFHITIEPILFLLGFTMTFTSGVTIDLLERNICHREYELSYTQCTYTISKDIKANVEGATAQVNMIKGIIEGIMPLFLLLFIGPWSDSNGRKPCLLWAQRGYVLYYFLWTIFSFFPHMPVIYFYIPSIPLGFTGAFSTVSVCGWSYISDNFAPEDRAMRFTITLTAQLVGNLIGNTMAEQVVIWGDEYGFVAVFFISFIISIISLLYTTFMLEETIVCEKKERTKLVDFNHVRNIIKTVIINPERGRWLIVFVLMVECTEAPAFLGDESIMYLVGKSHYNWTLGRFNLFSGLCALISGGAPIFGLWLLIDILKISNAMVLMGSCILMPLLQLLKAVSINETMFWVVNIMSGGLMIAPTIDSELASAVSEKNIGKAFTFMSLMVPLTLIVFLPLYTLVYTSLLPDRTLQVFFLSFGLNLITAIGSICVYIKRKMMDSTDSPKEPPSDDQINETTVINV